MQILSTKANNRISVLLRASGTHLKSFINSKWCLFLAFSSPKQEPAAASRSLIKSKSVNLKSVWGIKTSFGATKIPLIHYQPRTNSPLFIKCKLVAVSNICAAPSIPRLKKTKAVSFCLFFGWNPFRIRRRRGSNQLDILMKTHRGGFMQSCCTGWMDGVKVVAPKAHFTCSLLRSKCTS